VFQWNGLKNAPHVANHMFTLAAEKSESTLYVNPAIKHSTIKNFEMPTPEKNSEMEFGGFIECVPTVPKKFSTKKSVIVTIWKKEANSVENVLGWIVFSIQSLTKRRASSLIP
jgi:hypothetical protein